MEFIFNVVYLLVMVVLVVSMWKIYVKCGESGWACLVPIYNLVVFLRMARRKLFPSIILCFIPIVNIYITYAINKSIAERLREQPSDGFAVGMTLLPFIFLPVLAFGDKVSKYTKS